MKQAVESIKNQIKANAAELREIRKQIYASKGAERSHFWGCKRGLGDDTRHLLLAYACLRGRQYLAIEAKCASDNEPRPSAVLAFLAASLPEGGPERAEWTKDRVKAWLARPAASEAKEKAA
jgi:hypothetical protein